ncbi:MAG: response regulator transcription factor [Bacillota bacterium]
MAKQTILVVDDDPKVIKILTHVLTREGYEVISATDGFEALAADEQVKPNLVIMDIMLPNMDGLEATGKIKARRDVPVIVLSARGDETDRIVGFKMGADDYQCKPFSPAELVLRVKAVLRRYARTSLQHSEEILAYPEITINSVTRKVTVRGKEVELTSKEFELLWTLASQPNRVFTRSGLVERVWDSSPGDENTLTVHIRRLRKKIETDPDRPKFIKTVWGVGYKFEVPDA